MIFTRVAVFVVLLLGAARAQPPVCELSCPTINPIETTTCFASLPPELEFKCDGDLNSTAVLCDYDLESYHFLAGTTEVCCAYGGGVSEDNPIAPFCCFDVTVVDEGPAVPDCPFDQTVCADETCHHPMGYKVTSCNRCLQGTMTVCTVVLPYGREIEVPLEMTDAPYPLGISEIICTSVPATIQLEAAQCTTGPFVQDNEDYWVKPVLTSTRVVPPAEFTVTALAYFPIATAGAKGSIEIAFGSPGFDDIHVVPPILKSDQLCGPQEFDLEFEITLPDHTFKTLHLGSLLIDLECPDQPGVSVGTYTFVPPASMHTDAPFYGTLIHEGLTVWIKGKLSKPYTRDLFCTQVVLLQVPQDYGDGPVFAEARMGSYPGQANAGVTGNLTDRATSASLTLSGDLEGLPVNTIGAIHINAGYSCATANQVGDHWYNAASVQTDPWKGVTYSSDATGHAVLHITMTAVELGYDPRASVGHTVVAHSSDGARISCGVLYPAPAFDVPAIGSPLEENQCAFKVEVEDCTAPVLDCPSVASPNGFQEVCSHTGDCGTYLDVVPHASDNCPSDDDGPELAEAIMGSYPGQANAGVTGTVIDTATSASLLLSGVLNGLPVNTTGPLHIHAGYSCDTANQVGGHWYNATGGRPDPWIGVTYTSDVTGQAVLYIKMTAVELGYNPLDSLNHTVVAHSADGAKISCGVLIPVPGPSVTCKDQDLDDTGHTHFFDVGNTQVECEATDASGNTATCSFTVGVQDCEDPVVECTQFTSGVNKLQGFFNPFIQERTAHFKISGADNCNARQPFFVREGASQTAAGQCPAEFGLMTTGAFFVEDNTKPVVALGKSKDKSTVSTHPISSNPFSLFPLAGFTSFGPGFHGNHGGVDPADNDGTVFIDTQGSAFVFSTDKAGNEACVKCVASGDFVDTHDFPFPHLPDIPDIPVLPDGSLHDGNH